MTGTVDLPNQYFYTDTRTKWICKFMSKSIKRDDLVAKQLVERFNEAKDVIEQSYLRSLLSSRKVLTFKSTASTRFRNPFHSEQEHSAL